MTDTEESGYSEAGNQNPDLLRGAIIRLVW